MKSPVHVILLIFVRQAQYSECTKVTISYLRSIRLKFSILSEVSFNVIEDQICAAFYIHGTGQNCSLKLIVLLNYILVKIILFE